MRLSPYLTNLWNQGGPFIGLNKACAYVTVEDDWFLNEERSPGRMQPNRLPVRWWQRADNSQVEKELPNVQNIQITRNLSSDAAECSVTLLNVLPHLNEDDETHPLLDQWGVHGGLTLNHGQDADGVARWGHTRNEWFRVLRPGSLLRTYQGYGGWTLAENGDLISKPRADAIEDGNVMLTGVWRIDSVTPASTGKLTLACRDMASLLIDQIVYPPLVPDNCYPPHFWKYTYSTRNIPSTPPRSTEVTRRLSYIDSSQDRWYGTNAVIHGHRGTDSTDGRDDTFALSVGNSGPSRPFTTDWWEYRVPSQINSITLRPWAGNYDMYISVKVNGQWQGSDIVPYDHTPLIGRQPTVVDTGANIPYVAKYHVPWEEKKTYSLGRMYQAEAIRVSFRNHTKSPWGPWYYRCGIREISAVAANEVPAPQWVDLVAHPSGYGYWAVSNKGVIQSFGDALKPNSNISASEFKVARGGDIVAMDANLDGDGILLLTSTGIIFRRNTAIPIAGMPGPLDDKDAIAIVVNRAGTGYWVVRTGGETHAYGGAPDLGDFDATGHGPIVAAAHTGPDIPVGLYALYRDGFVQCRGDAIHQGNGPAGNYTDITPVADGGGYYLTETNGTIHRIGAGATGIGGINAPDLRNKKNATASALTPVDTAGATVGFATLTSDGYVLDRRDWEPLGHPAGGIAQVRGPGNYKDLTDIVELLLLWSGFHLKGGNTPSQKPAVYGNLESTGFAPDEPLSEDMFDKRSVIDCINTLKEITGYIFYVDQEGAVRYESPNFWESGNFLPTGQHTDEVYEIDERHNLLGFSPTQTLKNERSQITVSDGEPMADVPGVRVGRWRQPRNWVEQKQDYLRGMCVPAAIGVPMTLSLKDMQRMAELVAVQLFFKRRSSSGSAVAHPGIDINDQVRIWERTSSEQFLNYVVGLTTSHDLTSGSYTMDMQTYWLGAARNWAITITDDGLGQRRVPVDSAGVSEQTRLFSTKRSIQSDRLDPATVPLPDIDIVPDPEDDRTGPTT